MFRIATRFLKPFIPAIIMTVILLFVQAMSELYLPNLMSNIVNVGIQKGGIEEGTPLVMTPDAMHLMMGFMNDEEKALMEQSYVLVDGDSLDSRGKPYSDTWPEAAGRQVYVRTSLSDEVITQLDEAFGTATWTMLYLLEDMMGQGPPPEGVMPEGVTPEGEGADVAPFDPAGEVGSEQITGVSTEQPAGQPGGPPGGPPGEGAGPDLQGMDITALYGLIPMLDNLPDEAIALARARAEELEPSMRSQSATMLIASMYRELGVDMTAMELSYIARVGMVMLAVTGGMGLASVLLGFISARMGAGLSRNIRSTVFNKVASFSHTEFDRFSTASLITRTTNDVQAMQMIFTMGLRNIFSAPIMGIGAAYMAIQKSASMSWIIVLAAVVMLGGVSLQMAVVTPRFRIVQRLTDRLNLVARESLSGLMVVRAFNRDDTERERFDEANAAITKTQIFIGRVMSLMGPFMTIVMNGISITIIWVGGHQIAASQMQVGDMMAYMQYIMQVMFSFMSVSMMFNMIPRAQVSATRIMEVLETVPAIQDPVQPLTIDESNLGTIEFDNVSFRYEGAEENALSGISFKALPGQTVAFIGPTGSGKSSILNLIPRFYDVAEGSVKVDGVDTRQLTQAELRSHIGYVPQRSLLMGGSIATNIAYGVQDRELQYEEFLEIAEVAQALDFIGGKREGFYFKVAQGGANVSGGQKQRLSIARALAIKPDIYIFDDSFSALDFTTDAALRKALKEYTSDSTLLIVSQRIGTIMDADAIHVIDNGRIIGSGTHDELLDTCPEYLEIAATQLAEVAARNGSPITGDAAPQEDTQGGIASLTEGGEL